MDKSILKIVNIVTAIILGLGVVMTLLTAAYGKDFATNVGIREKLLNPFFILTYVTFAIAAIAALLFPLLMMIKEPKKLLGVLAIIGGIVILWLVSYALSGNSLSPERLQRLQTTARASKLVGAGLIFTYFIVGFTFLAFVITSLLNFFKK
ncbi:MAG: hypothetical protein NT175_08915 [Bacteroidetes bacterium]|nr:hypothetical protein [Bacteroidota bacterium]